MKVRHKENNGLSQHKWMERKKERNGFDHNKDMGHIKDR